ncbi:ABC transporter ATP-binding protein [Haladaptatus sp. T7]|uniref:ABC transporter ATP-binding protein n=1 Tax=Haladaptatus sp. T7 TaxID=2029368 RepID=UPI0021A25401|nr:ABC transporter ATP-binding protein [Haladaptatus sp. T7]GKZ13443.1 daunorubicin resistance protein DrrA family ABC transporter ATP-binding protein [Haladaptatus sp. T7]
MGTLEMDTDHTPSPSDSATGEIAVSVEHLTKEYSTRDGDAITAVDDVSFDIESGTIVGLLGPNGAGKTTTIKSTLGLLIPTDGSVHINGVDVHDDYRGAYENVSAVLEGNRNAYWRLTVRENLDYFASLQGIHPKTVRDQHDELLEQLRLTDKANEVVKDLSRGMKQKVSLAISLARDTPVVFMDEPTLGLDVEAARDLQRDLRTLVDEHDRTIVVSSHNMDVVQSLCDRVIIMNEGSIVVDRPVDALSDLFDTRTYRVVLEGRLPDSHRETVEGTYETSRWKTSDNRTEFTVAVETPRRLYDVVDILRDGGVAIESVSSNESDLEEVFLTITGDDGDNMLEGSG